MAIVDSDGPTRRRRSEARVECWRKEVATATGKVNSPLASPTSELPISLKSRPTSPESSSGRRKSFISFTKVKTTEHVPPPLERPGLLTRVKMSLKSMKPRGVERTGMYHTDIEGGDTVRADHDNNGAAENEGEKVVDIEILSDLSREKRALVAKRERLKRAAELLGNENGMVGEGQ